MPTVADAASLNRDLERHAPSVLKGLSPLGRRAFYPAGIPHQAAEARGTTYNGTIGQITDGHGHALPLPSMAAAVALEGADRDQAFLYSPVDGRPELRQAWRDRQRRGVDAGVPSTLPLVTDGLTHALSIAADLFGGEGRVIATPAPFWGNYRQVFTLRTGADIKAAPYWRDGRFNPLAVAEALAEVPAGEPAVAIVNAPSNPGGYMPTANERELLCASLIEVAASRPLVVLCDDAYAGLVYEDDIPRESMFWSLAGAHENLLAIKIDGATKELSFFGGRVGFITFGVEQGSLVEAALESKVKSLVRSTVGSPVASSQMLVLQTLRSPHADQEIEAVRFELEGRYRALKTALAGVDPSLLRAWPFNAGCFAVVDLPAGVDAEALRHHMINELDSGIVSIPPNTVRIAFCSVAEAEIPELVRRLEQGVASMVGQG